MALELPPDDDLDPLILRRRMKAAKARKRLIVWAGVGVGVLAVAFAFILLASLTRVLTPINPRGGFLGVSASSEGRSWNHRELTDHLQRRGLVFATSTGGTMRGRPSLVISTGDSDLSRSYFESLANLAIHGTRDLVLISKASTPQEAKDEAGVLGSSGYSWGRFVFHGDPDLVAKIRRILD